MYHGYANCLLHVFAHSQAEIVRRAHDPRNPVTLECAKAAVLETVVWPLLESIVCPHSIFANKSPSPDKQTAAMGPWQRDIHLTVFVTAFGIAWERSVCL